MEDRIIAVNDIDAEGTTYTLSSGRKLKVAHGGHIYHIGDTVGLPGSGLGLVVSGAGTVSSTASTPSPVFNPPLVQPVEPQPVDLKRWGVEIVAPPSFTVEEQEAADLAADRKEAAAE
jgi:hypothetical protein